MSTFGRVGIVLVGVLALAIVGLLVTLHDRDAKDPRPSVAGLTFTTFEGLRYGYRNLKASIRTEGDPEKPVVSVNPDVVYFVLHGTLVNLMTDRPVPFYFKGNHIALAVPLSDLRQTFPDSGLQGEDECYRRTIDSYDMPLPGDPEDNRDSGYVHSMPGSLADNRPDTCLLPLLHSMDLTSTENSPINAGDSASVTMIRPLPAKLPRERIRIVTVQEQPNSRKGIVSYRVSQEQMPDLATSSGSPPP